ncbi:hypothetical protein LSPH26S_03305 [Lysinibacillus sphaericus]
MICSILPRALVAPLAGYVADNYSKKRTILIAQAGTILTMASLLFYTETIGMSVNAIYVMTVFYTWLFEILLSFVNGDMAGAAIFVAILYKVGEEAPKPNAFIRSFSDTGALPSFSTMT